MASIKSKLRKALVSKPVDSSDEMDKPLIPVDIPSPILDFPKDPFGQRPNSPPPPYAPTNTNSDLKASIQEKSPDPEAPLSSAPSNVDNPDLPLLKPALSKKEVARNYFQDFCYFPDDYHVRIAKYLDRQLKKQEAVKTRICYSSMCSIISGTAFAFPTHGASAVVCLWAARRWYVAAKKLKFIRQELMSRKIQLRPFLHRDWIIPASVAIVFISIGCGVDFGVSAAVPLGHLDRTPGGGLILPHHAGDAAQGIQHAIQGPANATDPLLNHAGGFVPTDASQLHQAVNPSSGHTIAQEWGQGFKDQVQALFGQNHHAIADAAPSGGSDGAAAWLFGAESAELFEKNLAALLGQQAVQQMCERLDWESILPKYNVDSTCRKLPWATDNICSRCGKGISEGSFFRKSSFSCKT